MSSCPFFLLSSYLFVEVARKLRTEGKKTKICNMTERARNRKGD